MRYGASPRMSRHCVLRACRNNLKPRQRQQFLSSKVGDLRPSNLAATRKDLVAIEEEIREAKQMYHDYL